MARKEQFDFNSGEPPEFNNPFACLPVDNLPLGGPVTPEKIRPPKPGRVVLRRETAHRGGKTVVVIDDFAPSIPLQTIEQLGRRLRRACGCGGTTRARAIEIQGDQVAKIRALLEEEGFRVAGVK